VAALNILNEAEIGFKIARNKKLHVEFHLIRLTYLKQAIVLVDEGVDGKKKQLTDAKAVKFRAISFREIKKSESKLFIEEKKPQSQKDSFIEPAAPVIPQNSANATEPSVTGLGALRKIREQMQHRKQEQQVAETLTEARLKEAWGLYLEKLQENNQVTNHTNLKMAELKMIDEQVFEVLAFSRIQQQFIENERTGLLIHFQDFFRNTAIQFRVILDPSAEIEVPKAEQSLSMRDQYFKMIEMYPLIKELRDQLNLDLDY
jgi:DNA polymerase-3 subunit gamma/tau